eukprot:TRINITY_DN875_c0_g1_i1.p1 TRINITY_DN875_c0_g1~~TRINITY_DN875_c0_g1_i1.p1  ORF type:complete len:549 (-),score=169.41 TRINITY_DN875_c0_g1_i1:66-1712(-)
MYGFSYAFLREPEQRMPRAQSVPVMQGQKKPQAVADSRRAMSFSDNEIKRVWNENKGNPSFSEYLRDREKEPLVPQVGYQPPPEMQGSTLIPVLTTLLVGQGALLFGIEIGYSSPTTNVIKNVLGVDKTQVGLMWSWLNVGAMLGCLSAAPFADMLGRKLALLVMIVPFLVGGAMFYFIHQLAVFSVSRFITGIGVGLASVLVPLYIAESSPTHLRGALGSANQFLIAGGIVLVNAIGLPIVDNPDWWKTMIILSAIPLAVLLIGILTVGVETPRWLVSKGKEDEAEKSLRFLRGKDYNVTAELNDLLQSSKPDDGDEFGKIQQAPVNKWNFLFCKALRPLMIGISLQLLQQWSGINAIMFHTSELFVSNTNGDPDRADQLSALHGAILVNVVQVVMCGVTVLAMNRAGRRFFLILSHSGMAIAGTTMGFAYQFGWSSGVRMGIIMVYLAFFSLGVGPVPWLVCSEIYPAQVREIAMSLSTLVNWLSAFAVTAALQPLTDAVGSQGVFWLFSAVSVFGVFLIYFTLPETKDKTLEEIEAEFMGEGDDL